MKLLRILRRSTRPGDFRFIRTYGEFWVWSIGLSVMMLAVGGVAGILVGGRWLVSACFP